jgi:hypothetical protein
MSNITSCDTFSLGSQMLVQTTHSACVVAMDDETFANKEEETEVAEVAIKRSP